MAKQIAIIADDLTGANDSGVQLTEKGMDTSVLFEIPEEMELLSEGLVIDTNSRALNKADAISITSQATNLINKLGYQHVYKKMDSTLRGHIGYELKVMEFELDADLVLIAPAFPSMGRVTKNGYHYVYDELISETEISKDPKHPVTESHIPTLIKNQIGEEVGLITKREYEDETLLLNKLDSYQKENIKMVVFDAETEEDLRTIASRIASTNQKVVWAGSAGLAEVVPEVLHLEKEKQVTSYTNSNITMTVCGSLSQMTQKQVQYAMKQNGVKAVELNPTKMFQDDWNTYKITYMEECLTGFKDDKDVVLYVPSNEVIRKDVQEIGTNLGLTKNQIGETISEKIADLVTTIKEEFPRIDRFVLTGGDTAKATAQHLGAIGIHLIKQLEPGIPLGSLIGTIESLVVTKAGAFGKEDSIYKAMLQLKGEIVDE
ncbi:four-carbon acid sugar kinase family protein [Oceanobacillus sp. 1P07AA]|uniref:four-carbon acid sugar kinase family protein n=1 Tax=Oceanobacillus sp. 1P07AA TaxID=3132293 RepID=UPI0039A5D9F1